MSAVDLSSVVVVDVETTGLNPDRCAILEIGAVALVSGEEWSADCRAWQHCLVEDKALEVNGCTRERVFDASLPLACEVMPAFVDWMRARGLVMLAGMNPGFDANFLGVALGHKGPWVHRHIDMHSLAVMWSLRHGLSVPERGFYTNTIYTMLGLPPEPEPHHALTGARREAEALRVMLGMGVGDNREGGAE